MTMRVTIENVDESGRVLHVRQEQRLPTKDEPAWMYHDSRTLGKGEKANFYIHAASRLIVTEDPDAKVAPREPGT